MHFTYQQTNTDELSQGDVLRRTPELEEILKEIHPHFHRKRENLFFIILTQSCDLVIRGSGACKAPYIVISPVRSIDAALSRFLSASDPSVKVRSEQPIRSNKLRSKTSDFLSRLHNNNEPNYFFLSSSETELPCDCVAFLSMSIALKSDLHYNHLLRAKILQLNDTFQAKLGWLVGQMYSRVGTQDWDTSRLNSTVKQILDSCAIWIEDHHMKKVEQTYSEMVESDKEYYLTESEVRKIVGSIPKRKDEVLDRVMKILQETLRAENLNSERIQKRLRNDPELTRLLR